MKFNCDYFCIFKIKAKSLKFLSPQQAAMYYGISPCGTDFAVHDTRQAARNVPANDSNACRMVSITFMSRLRSRTAAKTRVESVRCRPRPFNRPRTSKIWSCRFSSSYSSPASTKRPRNSLNTEASNPASSSLNPNVYFQSIRTRTASAACRSDNPSTNCRMHTIANCHGLIPGCPHSAYKLLNASSSYKHSSSSRIIIAGLFLRQAAWLSLLSSLIARILALTRGLFLQLLYSPAVSSSLCSISGLLAQISVLEHDYEK